jgi:hypothetical protein
MSLLDDVSIVVTPNGYKAGELYAVIPVPSEGSEEVVNGDFATDTDWTKGTGWTISGGTASCDGTQTSNSFLYQSVLSGITRAKTEITISNYTSGNLTVILGGGGSQDIFSANGTYTFNGTKGSDNTFYIKADSSFVGSVDNVSVKEYTSADMDVTRATAATRVDENGLVNYAEVIGGEEVNNGDFSGGITGWVIENTWTISSGVADGNGAVGSTSELTQTPVNTIGKTYKATFEVLNYVSGTVGFWQGSGVSVIQRSANGIYTEYFTATSTQIRFRPNIFNGSITNVSVKEVIRDNVPRIDYTGGGCPHILAEPQRTNLVTYSEDFSQTNWAKTAQGTGIAPVVTSNNSVSPNGTLNADKIVFDTGSGTSGGDISMIQDSVSLSSGIKLTQSVYLKGSVGGETILMRGAGGGAYQTLTLTNDWVRYEFTETSIATTSYFEFGLRQGLGGVIINQTITVYVWGAQFEAGSYPTSYIPTSGSSVTRNQDIFTRDGIGSLINSTEGVLFAEIADLSDDSTGKYYSLSDGTSSNRIRIGYSLTDNSIRALVISQGTNVFDYTYTTSNIELFSKVAFSYKQDDFSFWIDGVKVHADTSGNTPTALSRLSLDDGKEVGTGGYFYGKVKQLQVYDTALTDNQLIQLTGEAGTHFFESYAEMASALTYTIQ